MSAWVIESFIVPIILVAATAFITNFVTNKANKRENIGEMVPRLRIRTMTNGSMIRDHIEDVYYEIIEITFIDHEQNKELASKTRMQTQKVTPKDVAKKYNNTKLILLDFIPASDSFKKELCFLHFLLNENLKKFALNDLNGHEIFGGKICILFSEIDLPKQISGSYDGRPIKYELKGRKNDIIRAKLKK